MRRAIPVILLLALVTSACQIRVDSVVTVNDDESGTFGLVLAFDEEFRQFATESGGDMDLTSGLDGLPAGWSEQPYAEDGFEGSFISASFTDFADLQRLLSEMAAVESGDGSPDTMFDTMSLRREGDAFRFEARIEGLEEGFSESGGDLSFSGDEGAAMFASLFDIRFVVTLPGSIGDHNADLVEGNTLIWNIGLNDEGAKLFATSSPGGLGFLPIAGAAVVLIGAGAFLFLRRRSSSDDDGPSSAALAAAAEAAEAAVPEEAVDGDPFAA